MTNSKKLTLIGLTTGAYPFGGASTARILSIFQGFNELGYSTQLYVLNPDKNQPSDSRKTQGIYKGVRYKYIPKKLELHKNILNRYLYLLSNTYRSIKLIQKEHSNKDTIVINYIASPVVSILISYLLKKQDYILFHEVTEFPFIRKGKSNFITNLYLKYSIPRYDRLFVLTNALQNYFKRYNSEGKTKKLNIVVEPKRFHRAQKSPFPYEYIAYCGMMNTDKDGIPILINAFSIVNRKYPDLHLVLIGDIVNRPINRRILEAIEQNNIADKIVFTGYVNSDNIPRFLNNARILALARPNNIQAKGGFPTKLGEYLATGNPVIVTNVGEIPQFIKHNHNGFISKPNPEDFAEQIELVLKKSDLAKNVGRNGRKLAYNQFNYLKIATEIEFEINDLINRNVD